MAPPSPANVLGGLAAPREGDGKAVSHVYHAGSYGSTAVPPRRNCLFLIESISFEVPKSHRCLSVHVKSENVDSHAI